MAKTNRACRFSTASGCLFDREGSSCEFDTWLVRRFNAFGAEYDRDAHKSTR